VRVRTPAPGRPFCYGGRITAGSKQVSRPSFSGWSRRAEAPGEWWSGVPSWCRGVSRDALVRNTSLCSGSTELKKSAVNGMLGEFLHSAQV